MKRIIFRVIGVLLLATIVFGVVRGPTLLQTVRLGAAYAAKTTCSGVFISGRGLESIHATDMNVAPIPISMIHVDESERSVTVSIGPISRTAIYRENCGCTVAQKMTVKELRAQPVGAPFVRPEEPEDAKWPEGNASDLKPAAEGIDTDALERSIRFRVRRTLPRHDAGHTRNGGRLRRRTDRGAVRRRLSQRHADHFVVHDQDNHRRARWHSVG